MRAKFWLSLSLALGCGLAIGWVDSGPNWDDTGVTVGAILVTSGLFGLALPRRAWVWALAVGVWVPALEVAPGGNLGSLVALAVAFAGAYGGALLRNVVAARRPAFPPSAR